MVPSLSKLCIQLPTTLALQLSVPRLPRVYEPLEVRGASAVNALESGDLKASLVPLDVEYVPWAVT